MRNHLTIGVIWCAAIGACAAGGAVKEEEMAVQDIDGIRLTLTVPGGLHPDVLNPQHVRHDPAAVMAQLTFENVSDLPIRLPLEEIGNGLVRIYSWADAAAPERDNMIPPPPSDGEVVELSPGARHVERRRVSPPATLTRPTDGVPVRMTFCLEWKAAWLRTGNYARGSIQWNRDFTICEAVLVTLTP
jgi:hypothetical protein